MDAEKFVEFFVGELCNSWKLEDLEKIAKIVKGTYGFIHDSKPAEVHGVRGFLIWDSIAYNEITFRDMDENIISLYTSLSNTETEAKWNELVNKFGT